LHEAAGRGGEVRMGRVIAKAGRKPRGRGPGASLLANRGCPVCRCCYLSRTPGIAGGSRMRRSFGLVAGVRVAPGVARLGPPQPPQPVPPTQPGQPVPWANKFFLPDIAANRDQSAPPVIVHNFGDVPHGTLCVHKFTVTNIYDVPMQITEVRKSCHCLDFVPMTKVLQPNEAADFTVTMNSGKFIGVNAQTFYITFGPKFISTAVIRVQANSRTDVSVVPGAVAFGTVAQGVRPAAQSVMIKYGGKNRDWKL